jgi:hypothetical protein
VRQHRPTAAPPGLRRGDLVIPQNQAHKAVNYALPQL